IEVLIKERARHADSPIPVRFTQRGNVVGSWGVSAVWILWVMAGDGLKNHSRIGNIPGNRAEVIQRDRQWHDSSRAHPPIRRLETDNSAKGGRLSTRTGSIGPDRAVAEARGDGGCRASRGSARDMRGVPWTTHFAVVADERTAAIGALVQIVLSK